DHLQNVRRKEVSERIRHTASQGDLKENAGYHMAKEEQGFIEGRISELKGILAQAKPIEKKTNGNVQIGSTVFLQSEGEKEKFQLVGPEEADILQGKVSFKSPLGEAIFNKKKGDTVKIETGNGQKTYKITGVK
ncbi:MAG: transcription elongation factor GreA, partial [Candidatus Portnoybacteria bacterium]